MDDRTKAPRGLAVFFTVLVAGSAYFEHKVLTLGGPIRNHLNIICALMWWITVSSTVPRLALCESPRDISFRWGGWSGTRAILVATVLPLVVGSVAYGIAWVTGLAHFSGPRPATRFLNFLLVMLTVGGLYSCTFAAGEEIGWRGYMLTRLIDSGVPAPILVSGLVWALWHTPLILSGQYASGSHPALSAVLFVGNVIGLGYVFAWLRLSSGSIWPCIWAHGVWNAVIQGPFDMSTAGYSNWVDESGVLTTVTITVFTIVLYRVWPLTQSTLPSKTARLAHSL
jgi:membrane protease YdiL (CAAX protease family)